MKARIFGLALVAAGFTSPAFAGGNLELAAAMQQHGFEASAAIRQDLAPQVSAERFEQVYAEIRSVPRYNTQLAELSEMPKLDASVASASSSAGAMVRNKGVAAANSAIQVVTPSAEDGRSTAHVLRMTFGIGLFGLSWNR